VTNRVSADALRDVSDPAWPQIVAVIEKAPTQVRVLHADVSRRDIALEVLQVTTGSFLGALVGECGALMFDYGWLRILGAGAEGLPGVHQANDLAAGPPSVLEVAWDALGGRFAINGGGLDAPPGEVCYWGPDTLDWQSIGGGHSEFISWALSDAIRDFYGSLRWPGWEGEIETLAPDQGLSLVPPPFTVEGRDPAQVSRSAVPMTELHAVYADLAEQLTETPDGSAFKLEVTE
jgi:hypothetical protein